jgi:hypothetical protein
MLEPHLIVQFRVNAIAWLLLPISISFYIFKGREGTRCLISKTQGPCRLPQIRDRQRVDSESLFLTVPFNITIK